MAKTQQVSAQQAEFQMRLRELVERAAKSAELKIERPSQLGPFLTISRQVDSGGAEVAREVGMRLGWAVFDKELVEDLAHQLKLSPQMLQLLDEKDIHWFTDTMLNLMNSRIVLQDSYVSMLGKLMHLAAYDGKVIFVGRGSHLLLPPGTGLKVRVIAPRAARIARFLEREHNTAEEAGRRVDALEESRVEFLRRHFRRDPDDPTQFDLVIDSSVFGIDGCVDLICRALELRGLV
jgi:cytidylate kinase